MVRHYTLDQVNEAYDDMDKGEDRSRRDRLLGRCDSLPPAGEEFMMRRPRSGAPHLFRIQEYGNVLKSQSSWWRPRRR